MGDKLPQPTAVLIQRLRRLARYHERQASREVPPEPARARANLCWQASARLEELTENLDMLVNLSDAVARLR